MAYLGSRPADRTSGARPRSEFLGDGAQFIYPLGQAVPGGFESSLFVVVDNVIQEPVEAYIISDLTFIRITNVVGTVLKNQILTVGDASGIIVEATNSFVRVFRTSQSTFGTGSATITNPGSTAPVGSATVISVQIEENTGLRFTGVPENNQNIYAVHFGGSSFQVIPSTGSVTAESLATNLKSFTIDKFVSTVGQTVFELSIEPVSSQSIIVTVNGSVFTDNVDFSLNGTTLTTAVPLSGNQRVTVFHLGFGSVSRNAFTDGSVTTRALEDLSVKTAKINQGAVTAGKLAAGVAVSNIGYTPANKAGDVVGPMTIDSIILGQGSQKGTITFPSTPTKSTDPTTLDAYLEGDWNAVLQIDNSVHLNQTSTGKFTKIGNRVYLTGTVAVNSSTAFTGDLSISGLPFSPSQSWGVDQFFTVMANNSSGINGGITGVASPASGVFLLFSNNTGTRTALTHNNIGTSTEFNFNFSYTTDD